MSLDKIMWTFTLGDEEIATAKKWEAEHDKTCRYAKPGSTGAIGGRFTFSFTVTSIGIVCKIACACGEEKDITDYSAW